MPLRGAGGEPVSFRATLGSHGLARLAPNEVDAGLTSLRTTVGLRDGRARQIVVTEDPPGEIAIAIAGREPSAQTRAEIAAIVRVMFYLDDDLSRFYAQLMSDGELSFAAADGVGRMLRSPTAFEDIVRTICTTNCAWSGTERMIDALVAHLGTAAPGAPANGWRGRAFPTPQQVAHADENFYRDVARAGYRGPYMRAFAASVVRGEVDVEGWRAASRAELSDDELEERLLELPGVGRCSRLVLDSWTRPRYAQLMGKKKIADRTIARRFKLYGDYAGLAFWLLLWKARHLGDEKHG